MHHRSTKAIIGLWVVVIIVVGLFRYLGDHFSNTGNVDVREAPTLHPLLNGKKLDINRASVDDLILIPGIGQSRAEAIVDARSQNGPFRHVDELRIVRGIGPKTVSNLKNWVRIGLLDSAGSDMIDSEDTGRGLSRTER